ncbi:MAG: hypothetical protein K0Q94_4195 [Paenibacillus sp.]|nr:hypothetical protein [Paenibacillus sp.]
MIVIIIIKYLREERMQHIRSNRERIFVVGAIAIMILFLLAACGNRSGGEPGEAKSSADASRTEEPAGAEQGTRTVKDDLGRQVEIPAKPERIIAGEFASELLSLGVKPVGAGDNGFKVVYTLNAMAGVERIGDPPNPEKILSLKPDLIIAPTVFQDIYAKQMEQLDKVAPIFYISFDQDPIYDIFTKVAELVGKTKEAQAWIAEYEREAAAARKQLASALGDQTVSIFRVEKGRLRIYLNRNFAGYMLRSSLQVKAPAAVAAEMMKNKNSSAVEISLESLPQYAGDHLFLIVRGEGADQQAFQEIQRSGLWNSLEAVKRGNVHFLDTDKYYGSDIVTIRETMKEAAQMLAGSVQK